MVAFCDLIEERAINGAKNFGTPDAKVFTDYRDVLDMKEIDVVHVCTTNDAHAMISIAAMEAGKHVMCEKPMAINAEQARQMLAVAKRTGKKLTIGYQSRSRIDLQYLKKMCDDGELGDIYFTKALAVRRRGVPNWGDYTRRAVQGGGPLIDVATHAVDMVLWLANNYKPVSVMGSSYRELADTKNAANAWGPWDPEKFDVEDAAFGFVKFENGMTMIVESSWALNTLEHGEVRCALCGTKAGADLYEGLRINGEKDGTLYITKPTFEGAGVAFNDAVPTSDPSEIEAQQWIEAIRNNTEPLVKPEEALVVSEILEAIYESAKTGQPVYFK
jgi:predicted dehydrogenase